MECGMEWNMEWNVEWNGIWNGMWNGIWNGMWNGLWNGVRAFTPYGEGGSEYRNLCNRLCTTTTQGTRLGYTCFLQ